MADFAAVLRKTIGALKESTPEARAKVYQKARVTIDAKLAAVSPPPPPQLIERQKGLLEDAIAQVEAEYAAPVATAEPDDDLESGFAGFDALAEKAAPPVDPADTPDSPDAAQGAATGDEAEDRPAAESGPAADAGMAPSGPEEAEPASEEESVEEADYDARVEAPVAAFGDERQHAPEWLDSGATDVPVEGPEAIQENAVAAEENALPPDGGSRRSRRGAGGLIVLLLFLVVLGAAGYGAWLYRDRAARLAGFESFDRMVAWNTDAATVPDETAQEASDSVETDDAEADSQMPAGEEQPTKFTQRLLANGEEVDEGPAGGEPGLGEGTSVAQATQSGEAPGEDGAPEQPVGEESLPVGQRAIFYEERTSASQGSVDTGAVTWSIVEESPGDNLPPEPVIRGEARIPEKGLQLKLTIRRNVDQSLPASHIVELIFLTPDDFQGGGIDNVLRIAMKRSEQDTGSPLLGIPAKIADGFFLVALSDSRADIEANTLLMQRQSWIDIPIVYTSGRRALITMEKGVPGERVFNEALDAWEQASSG